MEGGEGDDGIVVHHGREEAVVLADPLVAGNLAGGDGVEHGVVGRAAERRAADGPGTLRKEAEAPRKLAGDALGLDVAHAGEADADVGALKGALLGAQGGGVGGLGEGPVGEGGGGGAEHLFELGAEAAGVEGAAELEGHGAGAGGIARVVKVVKVVGVVVGVVLLALVLLGVEGEDVEEDEDGGGGAKGAAGVAFAALDGRGKLGLDELGKLEAEDAVRAEAAAEVLDVGPGHVLEVLGDRHQSVVHGGAKAPRGEGASAALHVAAADVR